VGCLTDRAQAVLIAGAVVAVALLVPLSLLVELQAVQTQPTVEPMDVEALDHLLHTVVRSAAADTDGSLGSMDPRIRTAVSALGPHELAHGRVVRVAVADGQAATLAARSCPVAECRSDRGVIVTGARGGGRVVGVVFRTSVLGPSERGTLTTTVWLDTAAAG
jgi:hypothetical protein